jgi:hypothetical protein
MRMRTRTTGRVVRARVARTPRARVARVARVVRVVRGRVASVQRSGYRVFSQGSVQGFSVVGLHGLSLGNITPARLPKPFLFLGSTGL